MMGEEKRTRLVGCVLGSEAVGLLEGSCVVLKRWRGGWRKAWFLCLFRVFLVFCRLVEGVGRGVGVGLLGAAGRCGGWRWGGRGWNVWLMVVCVVVGGGRVCGECGDWGFCGICVCGICLIGSVVGVWVW